MANTDLINEGLLGAYHDELMKTHLAGGVVFDISAYNLTNGHPTPYTDLAAALGTNGANVPDALRKGGMSVKFVRSDDNKYVQFRLMAQDFTTDVTQWQGIINTIAYGSSDLVDSDGIAKSFMKLNAVGLIGQTINAYIGGSAIAYNNTGNYKTLICPVIESKSYRYYSGVSGGGGAARYCWLDASMAVVGSVIYISSVGWINNLVVPTGAKYFAACIKFASTFTEEATNSCCFIEETKWVEELNHKCSSFEDAIRYMTLLGLPYITYDGFINTTTGLIIHPSGEYKILLCPVNGNKAYRYYSGVSNIQNGACYAFFDDSLSPISTPVGISSVGWIDNITIPSGAKYFGANIKVGHAYTDAETRSCCFVEITKYFEKLESLGNVENSFSNNANVISDTEEQKKRISRSLFEGGFTYITKLGITDKYFLGYINTYGDYSYNATGKYKTIVSKVTAGRKYKLFVSGNNSAMPDCGNYAFYSSNVFSNDNVVLHNTTNVVKNTWIELIAPTDAQYFAVCLVFNDTGDINDSCFVEENKWTEQIAKDFLSVDNKLTQKADLIETNKKFAQKADLVEIATSRNLFNKNNLVNGYINTTGGISGETNPDYKCCALIPIVAGEIYVLTYPTGLINKGLRFLDANGNQLHALKPTGDEWDYIISVSQPVVKAPATAVSFQFQVEFNGSVDLDTAQFELGDTPTEHVPYTSKNVLAEDEMPISYNKLKERVSNLENKKNEVNLNFDSNSDSYIVSDFNSTNKIKLTFWLNENTRNDVFNFRDIYLVNKLTGVETNVKAARDDVAPPFFQPGPQHLGGNHGANILIKLTVSSHNKDMGDIGSIWSDGTHQFTIAQVESGYLYFIGQNLLEYPSFQFAYLSASGTLTHISGATHTTDITYTARVTVQWWPFYKTRSVKSVFIDGGKVEQNGIYAFDVMKVSEDYDILNPASVLAKIQEGVGTFTQNPTPQDFADTADLLLHISHVFTFNSAAECMVAENLCIYQNVSNFSHHGFTQSATLLGDNKKIYIPKAKSKGNGATAVNFRTIADISDAIGLIRYDDWEVPTLPPDRILVFDDNIGLQVGYLFDYGVGGSNRAAALPANTAVEISDIYKLYPYGWNIANTTLPSYSNKSAVCFRNFIDRSKINTNGIISTCVFEYNKHCYIYADFNAAGDYEIEIPAKYQGGQIETLEKRDNVILLTQNASEKVLIHVNTDEVMYGYFVGKI